MSAAPKLVADRWLAERDLPSDLSGQTVHLVTFASDEDCAFFYPRRVALFHYKVNGEIAPQIRKRKGKVLRSSLSPKDYSRWLARQPSREDTLARRLAFAESRQGILKEPGHTGS